MYIQNLAYLTIVSAPTLPSGIYGQMVDRKVIPCGSEAIHFSIPCAITRGGGGWGDLICVHYRNHITPCIRQLKVCP